MSDAPLSDALRQFEAAVAKVADATGCPRWRALGLPKTLLHTVQVTLDKKPESKYDACYELHLAAAELLDDLYVEDDEGDGGPSTATTPAPAAAHSIDSAFGNYDESCADLGMTMLSAGQEGSTNTHPLGSGLDQGEVDGGVLECGMTRGMVLGRGAFGCVSKAMDPSGCVYAVKELILHSQAERMAAQSEYSVLKQLAHCNIVRVWDFQVRGDRVAEIVMSYWTQGSIQHQLQEFGALPRFTVRKYVVQMLEGLGYLHSVTVLHRDVKPANALVDASGLVALTDFGLASLQANAQEVMLVGSPPYMSPEIVAGKGYTPSSDIWALGCSVLEMVTALRPWALEQCGPGSQAVPPGELWRPETFFLTVAEASREGRTPLDFLTKDIKDKLGRELLSWLGLCFGPDRHSLTCRALAEHSFLLTPTEKMRRSRALIRASSSELMGCDERSHCEHLESPAGPVTVYSSLRRRAFEDMLQQLRHPDHPVNRASAFDSFSIRRGMGPGYSNADIDMRRIYCGRKRPAHALAAVLGRTGMRQELEADCYSVELSPPLMARTDDEAEVLIDAAALDRVSEEEREHGLSPDRVFDEVWEDPDRPEGPGGAEIYGPGAFRITVGELKRMARTVHVELSSAVPRKFFAELVAMTRGSPQRVAFWSAHRAMALMDVGRADKTDTLRQVVQAEATRARESEAELAGRRSQIISTLRTSRSSYSPLEETQMSYSSMPNMTGLSESPAEPGSPEELEKSLTAAHSHYHAESFRARRGEKQVEVLQKASRIARALEENKPVGWFRSEVHELQKLLQDFNEWRSHVMLFPGEYGFPTAADARAALMLSLTELCTHVCLSEQCYLLVDGCDGDHNQLHERAKQPVTILSTAGLDFMRPGATVREASKYFHRPDTTAAAHRGWRGFLPLAEHRLRERLKGTYAAVFASAGRQGVRNVSMLPMGLGNFLENLEEEDRVGVRRAYFQAQFELLCDRDWGFEHYYLNAGPPSWRALAEQVLDEVLKEGSGRRLRLHAVILHECDGKYLAGELAKRAMAPALLNPSDVAGIMLGMPGTSWELGRGHTFSAEQDLCAHSTLVISRSAVSISAQTLQN